MKCHEIYKASFVELRWFSLWFNTLKHQHPELFRSDKVFHCSTHRSVPCLQALSETARAVRCRWWCLPLWSGSGMACLSQLPLIMSRTKSFRKQRGSSKGCPRSSASFLTAAHLGLDRTTSSKSYSLQNIQLLTDSKSISTGFL